MVSLLKLLHDLGWTAPALFGLALASGIGAWRGRAWATLILPVGAALVTLATSAQVQGLPLDAPPDLWSSALARALSRHFDALAVAGVSALALLPAVRGAGRARGVGVAVLVGVLWPTLSLLPGLADRGHSGAVEVAVCMCLAGIQLLRAPRPHQPPLVARAAYASFAAVVAAAATSSVYVVSPHKFGPGPDGWCGPARGILLHGTVRLGLAILAVLVAAVPLWLEARRLGRGRWASAYIRGLVVCVLAMSPLNVANFTFFGPRSRCAPSPYATLEVGLVPER